MAKRTYRSAEEWRSIVREQQSSGLSAHAFCEAHSLGYASFINWRRRLGGGGDGERSSTASFIELTPANGVPSAPALSPSDGSNLASTPFTIELSLGHGIELRITRPG